MLALCPPLSREQSVHVLFKEPLALETDDRNTDKGEVGGSSPPGPTIKSVTGRGTKNLNPTLVFESTKL